MITNHQRYRQTDRRHAIPRPRICTKMHCAVKTRSFVCLQQQQYGSSCDISGCGTSTVAMPAPGACTDHGDYNDDSPSNTDTASETSTSAHDCSDGSTTYDRHRRCSRSSRRLSAGYHGGRRREQPPAVFSSLAERRAWERERLKKDNHNTSRPMLINIVAIDY